MSASDLGFWVYDREWVGLGDGGEGSVCVCVCVERVLTYDLFTT